MKNRFKPLKVAKNVALNPIARAVRWKALYDLAINAKIQIMYLKDGEEAMGLIQELSRFIYVALIAAQHEGMTGDYVEVLDKGLLHLAQMSDDQHRWKAADVWIVDEAIDAATLLAKKLKPQSINHASRTVEAIDQKELSK